MIINLDTINKKIVIESEVNFKELAEFMDTLKDSDQYNIISKVEQQPYYIYPDYSDKNWEIPPVITVYGNGTYSVNNNLSSSKNDDITNNNDIYYTYTIN